MAAVRRVERKHERKLLTFWEFHKKIWDDGKNVHRSLLYESIPLILTISDLCTLKLMEIDFNRLLEVGPLDPT